MDKTLYLHIGHYKTGTTALQVFLSGARRFLKRNGLDYPDISVKQGKHSAFVFSILQAAGVEKLMYGYRGTTPPQTLWAELFDHIAASDRRATIVSSEEFMRIGEFPEAEAILARILAARPEGLRVRAIVYLRAPDAHLESWFNQLVKLRFPMPDLNAAVDGEIEEIHLDYRRALEPWQRLLGVENVLIRPYVRDPDVPDALHRDFMGVLGVDLPKGQVKLETDPNPRIDDRVLDLVRLMQNLQFPRGTIATIRSQATGYLKAQDALRPGAPDGMAAARDRARAGLDWLAGQPGCTVPAGAWAERLPRPQPREAADQALVLGFVLSELVQLRQRVNAASLPDMGKRLDALEARLAKLEGKP